MTKVSCSVPEQFVNPLFEVFDGGDFILSSYRDVEKPFTDIAVYFDEKALPEGVSDKGEACAVIERKLKEALEIVGINAEISQSDVPDDDWMFAYRRHFKTELVSQRILVQPEWEELAVIKFDPGMAFGTGKHETTKACLQYIDECAVDGGSFLDMGCGSGILSIADDCACTLCSVSVLLPIQSRVIPNKAKAPKNRLLIRKLKFFPVAYCVFQRFLL